MMNPTRSDLLQQIYSLRHDLHCTLYKIDELSKEHYGRYPSELSFKELKEFKWFLYKQNADIQRAVTNRNFLGIDSNISLDELV